MRPEHETPHVAHSTGRRWLDLTLALCAMFVSLMSLAVAVHHGSAMDRLVAANSWPFLSYDTDNLDLQGKRRISLKVENTGIGPARIETFEVWWQGQPVATGDAQTFLSLELKDVNADISHGLNVARLQLKMRACYCSVFDECWETELTETSAKRVRSCPAVKVPFTAPAHWFESMPVEK